LYRFIFLTLILFFIATRLNAQDDTTVLQGRLTMLTYADKVQSGVVVSASIGDGRSVRIVVASDGWGEGRPEDVAAVCVQLLKLSLTRSSQKRAKSRRFL